MRWLGLIAAVLALLIGGQMALHGGGRQDRTARQDGPAARSDLVRLQTLAEDACRCTRRAGAAGEAACWQDFRAMAPAPPISGDITACAPVSTETACYRTAAGEACIVTGYDVNVASVPALDRKLCSAAEAQAVEQAFAQGWLGPDGEEPDPADQADWDASNTRAIAAAEQVLRRIRNGEPVDAAGPAVPGCTG